MILILGSNGQLGNSLKTSKPKNVRALFLSKSKCDISNFKILESYIKKLKPVYIINAAAYTDVAKAEKEKKIAMEINCKSLKKLSIFLKKYKFTLIHISTDFVFSGKSNVNYGENDKTYPISIYGKTKLLGEKTIINNSNNYLIIRTSGLFSHFKQSFLYKILKKLNNKKNLHVVSNQISYPTYSFDLSLLLWKIISGRLKIKFNEIYHYTGHEIPISWYNFAKKTYAYAKKYNKNLPKVIPIDSMNYFDKVKRPNNSCLSNKKISLYYNIDSNIYKNIKESVDLFYKNNSK